MRTIKELNQEKVPVIRIDETLDKYETMILFPDKVDKANEMLKTAGLPKPADKHKIAK